MAVLDHLKTIFKRSPNEETKAVLEAIQESVGAVSRDVQSLKAQFDIGTAEGEWLDEWGTWFSPRKVGESDADYSARILALVSKPRVTIPAILEEARRIFGEDTWVTMLEPYTLTFILGESKLSGDHRFSDERYYRTGTIDLSVSAPLPPRVLDNFQEIKSGGVIIYITHVPILVEGDGILDMGSSDEVLDFNTKEINMFVDDVHALELSGELGLISGRPVLFRSIEKTIEYFSDSRRKASESTVINRDMYPELDPDDPLWDEVHTSVSYDKEASITVEADEVSRHTDLVKEINSIAIQSTDAYAGSVGSVEYWLELEDDPYHTKSDYLKSIEYTKPFDYPIYAKSLLDLGKVSSLTVGELLEGLDPISYNIYTSNGGIVGVQLPGDRTLEADVYNQPVTMGSMATLDTMGARSLEEVDNSGMNMDEYNKNSTGGIESTTEPS